MHIIQNIRQYLFGNTSIIKIFIQISQPKTIFWSNVRWVSWHGDSMTIDEESECRKPKSVTGITLSLVIPIAAGRTKRHATRWAEPPRRSAPRRYAAPVIQAAVIFNGGYFQWRYTFASASVSGTGLGYTCVTQCHCHWHYVWLWLCLSPTAVPVVVPGSGQCQWMHHDISINEGIKHRQWQWQWWILAYKLVYTHALPIIRIHRIRLKMTKNKPHIH